MLISFCHVSEPWGTECNCLHPGFLALCLSLKAQLQAREDEAARQHAANSLIQQHLQERLKQLEGSSNMSQSLAEQQHGLLMAAQRKLYSQHSRLIDSVETLRREIESLAVEQALQVSFLCWDSLANGTHRVGLHL